MRMQKYIYRCGAAVCLLALAACSSEQFEKVDLTPGDTPIVLSGITTRGSGATTSLDAYTNSSLKLTSKIDNSTTSTPNYVDYFTNVNLSIATEPNADKSKLSADNAYYPLKDKEIYLFGHTGSIENNKMLLTSGKAAGAADLKYDYLISNGANGTGTSSNSKNGANEAILTFRHVMTKLDIAIKVDTQSEPIDPSSPVEPTLPADISFRFKDGLVSKTGKYAITTSAAGVATDLSTEAGANSYSFSVGTHYLIPNGKKLSGTELLSYLKIDDYIATAEDLKAIEVPQVDLNGAKSDLILQSGLAYKLTFEIKRLKVVGITLKVEEWGTITTSQPEWGYDPYKMTLSVSGGYDLSQEDNKITQVVLHHEVGGTDYQYVGKGTYSDTNKNTDIEFLSIPKALDGKSVLKVDAYTKHGLLIEGQEVIYTAGVDKGDISLNLSSNGMVTDGTAYLISTPLQFYNFLKNPQANTTYRIFKNIDMEALKDLPLAEAKEFPAGSTLQGGVYDENGITRTNSILHLNRVGGLFSTNKGTLKNIYIFSGTITAGKGTHMGSICDVNEGEIAGCVNEADLVPNGTQTAGGICGKNNGTVLACLNTGNIQTGAIVGGICGENARDVAGTIKACISIGMLNKNATTLGGVCGTTTSTSKIVNTCYWLTGTARKAQDINNERAVGTDADNGTCENASDLAPVRLRADDIIQELSTAAVAWKFKLIPEISVWPIPNAVP